MSPRGVPAWRPLPWPRSPPSAVSQPAARTTTSRRPARSPAKLVVDTFGEFGYDELVKQYEKDTGIKVELRKTAQLGEYRPKLVRYLATGKGAADVVALEEGILNEFKTNPAQLGRPRTRWSRDHSKDYLPWKWELGKAPDGRLIGLPTDVGSLAVCYRKDLFQAAGLPTERDQVVGALAGLERASSRPARSTSTAAAARAFIDSITTVCQRRDVPGQR